MNEGMPKPKSTYDTLRDRGRDIDAQVDAAVNPTPTKVATPKPVETKGLPKPGLMDRIKKMIGK